MSNALSQITRFQGSPANIGRTCAGMHTLNLYLSNNVTCAGNQAPEPPQSVHAFRPYLNGQLNTRLIHVTLGPNLGPARGHDPHSL